MIAVVRKRPELTALLLIAAGLAWWSTARRMAGMDSSPGADLGALGWFTGSWALMMAAMMLPSLSPSLVSYLTAARARVSMRPVLFTCGYLLVWIAAGVLAYGVFEVGKHVLGGALAWRSGGRWASGALLTAAAAYELLPIKRTCQMRCRGELAAASDDAFAGALMMGVRSGGWCVGSSWGLMAALFALGVMSLTWMVLIAALVAFEKLGPWPGASRLVTAAVLLTLAIGVFVAPERVPGFVVPHAKTPQSMQMMG
jgi:predicted metal-binding membrane protein